MSYCEVYAVRPSGDVTLYGEAGNAWGGAMHIWLKLNEKYGFEQEKFPGADYGPMPTFKPLWGHILNMSEPDQWVLGSTFDHVIVLKPHLTTLIKHLEAFAATYPSSTLAEELAILHRADKDPKVRGVCFNQTSVNSNPWRVYPKENGEGRRFNIGRDLSDKHWFMSAESFTKSEA